MIKLIAIDLDGTLLTDNKELPPDFWKIAEALISKGIKIVIASGRPFHNIAAVFEKLRNHLYFVSDNGTFIVHGREELLVNNLSENFIKQIIKIARPIENVYPVLCGKQIAFIENTDDEFVSNALKYYQEYEVVEDLTRVNELILKVSLCDLISSEINSYPYYRRFENDYSIAVSGKMWLDITNLDGTKGIAIKKIQELLGIAPEETMAFGDYMNDLDMIQNAKYGYAMKNAHPKVIESAKYITEFDNNHFGVTSTIKKIFSL